MTASEKSARTLIKICGARNASEARAILDLGADAVGVVVAAGSPRRVHPSEAVAIADACGKQAVLVLRGSDQDCMDLLRSWPGPVQIHEPIGDPGRPCIVASNAATLSAPEAWPSSATALLLDAPQAGSGAAWDWTKAQNTPRHLPCILAGGLNPANVATAINAAHPWAVDVSSGVEHARGTKDLGLVQAFIAAVRSCDAAAGRHDAPYPADFATRA